MKLINTVVTVVFLLASQFAYSGDEIDQTLEVTATGEVAIENLRGKVKIVGWQQNKVHVSGELDDKAKGYEFETDDGYTIFKVKMPRNMKSRQFKNTQGSDLTIKLPVDSKVTFESVNGDVTVSDVKGGAKIHTVNGNIKATSLNKRIELTTVNGNINAKKLDGKFQLSTVNGRVKDRDSTGKAHFETVNGSINSNTQAKSITVENVNGSIDLDLPKVAELEIATVNGEVDAKLVLLADAQIDITSVSGSTDLNLSGEIGGDYRLNSHAGGRIRNALTDDAVKKQKYGPSRSARFSIAGGDAKVEITSVSGDISIDGK